MFSINKATHATLKEALKILILGATLLSLVYVTLFSVSSVINGEITEVLMDLFDSAKSIGVLISIPLVIAALTGITVLVIFGRFEKHVIYYIAIFTIIVWYIISFMTRAEWQRLESSNDWLMFFLNGFFLGLVLIPIVVWAILWRITVNFIIKRRVT